MLSITTTDAGGAVVTPAINWTDRAGATSKSFGPQGVVAAARLEIDTILYSTGAADISYQATVSGSIGGARYALDLQAVRLGTA